VAALSRSDDPGILEQVRSPAAYNEIMTTKAKSKTRRPAGKRPAARGRRAAKSARLQRPQAAPPPPPPVDARLMGPIYDEGSWGE
jgi:hypothetical protein